MYEIKVSYVAVNPKNGNDVAVKESLILENAESFSEAEEVGYEYGNGLTSFDVTDIKRSKLKEVANTRSSEEEKIFLATLVDVTLGDNGEENEMKYTVAFFSKDMDSAHAYIKQYTSQGYNMAITKIVESKFTDVLK